MADAVEAASVPVLMLLPLLLLLLYSNCFIRPSWILLRYVQPSEPSVATWALMNRCTDGYCLTTHMSLSLDLQQRVFFTIAVP